MKFTQDQSESNNMRIIKADEGSNFQQPASTVSRELDQEEEEEEMVLMREMAASRQMEDAFLVCNASKIKHNVQQWKEEVPLTRPYYDIFCNSSALVLATVASASSGDCGFVAKSKDELNLAMSPELGIDPSRIILKTELLMASHLKLAAKYDIGAVAFGTAADLGKIEKCYPNARLLLSLDPVACKSSSSASSSSSSTLASILSLLRQAKERNLNIVGVTLKERQQWEEERLSCGTDVQKDFRKLVALAKLVFVAGKSAGHSEMHILDLGTPNVKDPEWKENYNFLVDCLDQQFDIRDFGDSETEQSEGSQPLVLIGHANEFFVDDSMHLAVQIAGKRVARSGERRSYILKEGIFGAFGRVLIDDEVSFKPAPLQAGYSSHSILPSDFYGPSGDDLDVIGKGLDLPDMEEGDWIVFKDHGHYSMCPRTQENFFAIQVPGGRFNCDLWALLQRKDETAAVAASNVVTSSSFNSTPPRRSSRLSNLSESDNQFETLPFAPFTYEAEENLSPQMPEMIVLTHDTILK